VGPMWGLTCVSVTMPVRHPAIHWLTRESTTVYGCERHLQCALRCRCVCTGNETADPRPTLPKKPTVGASHAGSPFPVAFKRLDGILLVLHRRS
jgi:hypothetical protein